MDNQHLIEALKRLSEDSEDVPVCVAVARSDEGDIRVDAWTDGPVEAITGILAKTLIQALSGRIVDAQRIDALDTMQVAGRA